MKYRAELRVVAIARDAMVFLAAVLALAHLVDALNIVGHNKLPIAEPFSEHFVCFPSEESLRSGRPAQDAEFLVPFDDGELRVLDVKGETTMLVGRGCFREFAFSHVANDGDATDDFALLVVTRRVITIEETVPTGLG